MSNPYFRFKQFTIYQEKTAMKVGTDGVLLGAWANLEHARRVLDIGTGTGLIAIMAAQRAPRATIEAIEIDPSAYQQALENVARCPWHQHLRVHLGAIQDFHSPTLFDALLCNPPFFKRSLLAPDPGRAIARHCTTLSHEDLLLAAQRLLTPEGKISLILPVNEAQDFIRLAENSDWFINKMTDVFPTPQKPRKRCLLELSRLNTPCTRSSIIIENERHAYNDAFVSLVKDFYLNL